MAKINILDSSIYNRISAGEVVDRPYSVVKEFVENSLDAGAKNITIKIERGGKESILVSDDGTGIEKTELKHAFLPHATSKISKVEDLDLIRTLGFRGEALASIASVSHTRIRSRHKDCDTAYEITCSGGVINDIFPCALDTGTEICAENLFFNTPVRAKFLKGDKGEESEISNFVSRFILGNPNVAFRYFIDGKLVLQSFGGGIEEAITAVYGSSVIAQCYRLNAEKHGIRLRGYIGKPSFSKANRTYQSVFVNGRYVINSTISSAITNAYGSYLMKRQYPFYVLFLDVPPEVVDVNVHPNKSDVRFENNQVIYGIIYSVFSSVLDGNAAALEYVADESRNSNFDVKNSVPTEKMTDKVESRTAVFENSSDGIQPVLGTDREFSRDQGQFKYKVELDAEGPKISLKSPQEFEDQTDSLKEARIKTLFSKPKDPTQGVIYEFHDSGVVADADATSEDAVFNENKRYLEALENKKKQQKLIFEQAEYKGCLFNTYLLYEESEGVYIIDQHAAHERLLYDRLKKEMEERKVVQQPMLIPFVLNLNREEYAFVEEHLSEIQQIGFEIEDFGGEKFKISAVPVDLQDIDLTAFFNDLLMEVGALRTIRLSEVLKDRIAMTACKHAVKGGMQLSDSEKEKLFELLKGDMGLKCPHGRPVAIRMTKTEIEKMFKRIV